MSSIIDHDLGYQLTGNQFLVPILLQLPLEREELTCIDQHTCLGLGNKIAYGKDTYSTQSAQHIGSNWYIHVGI